MKKLKLDFQQLNAEVLTRSQLKQILGGTASTNCTCTCEGGNGSSWFYNYEPSRATIDQDILDTCSTQLARCSGCTHIMD
jgi:natural product precursor